MLHNSKPSELAPVQLLKIHTIKRQKYAPTPSLNPSLLPTLKYMSEILLILGTFSITLLPFVQIPVMKPGICNNVITMQQQLTIFQ
jgi:hypothetical protein